MTTDFVLAAFTDAIVTESIIIFGSFAIGSVGNIPTVLTDITSWCSYPPISGLTFASTASLSYNYNIGDA